MWDKPILTHSSNLVSLPALAGELLGGVLAAFFGQGALAAVLLLIFLLSGTARLWGRLALRQVKVRVTGGSRCLFPDQETTLELELQNDKFFPLVWLELFFPLDERLSLVPERSRRPDDWEAASLREQKANTELVGGMRLRPLLWYETTRISCRWTAKRRGVYNADGWRLRTGDGFGLTCRERALLRPGEGRFVVYPRLTDVSPELFLRNLWNAETGARGVMEDPTVIRSTRDYLTTDSPRQINWRLLARGLPLTVNVYESILPRSVHFLLDGESFSGPEPHPEALEETLSILASELVRLDQAKVRCGLSLCKGSASPAVTLPAATAGTSCCAPWRPMIPCRRSWTRPGMSSPRPPGSIRVRCWRQAPLWDGTTTSPTTPPPCRPRRCSTTWIIPAFPYSPTGRRPPTGSLRRSRFAI